MNKKAIIESMFQAINADDKDALLALFSEEAVFENVPMGIVTGKEAIWEVLAPIHDIATGINWKVHRLELGSEGTVFSERTDCYEINGQWAEFRCAGIHEMNAEGKITLWRDYFDLKQAMATIKQA